MIKRVLRYFALFWSLFILCSAYPDCVLGDEIVLENGDRLTGAVKKIENGILVIETGYSEPIKIKFSEVKRIRTDKALEMHLDGGEVLQGVIDTDDEGKIVVESSEIRGPVSVERNRIVALGLPGVKPSQWHGNISIGANTQSGNTDRTNIAIGADALRKTEKDRYSLKILYNYAKEESDVTARNYYGAGKYDYFFTRSVYGYLGVELLKDEFKDIKLRTVVGPGAGYQFWDYPEKSLLFEAGLSYFSENLSEGEDKDWITARLAADLMYKIRNAIVFSDDLIFYPSLENARDYKLRNEASLNSPLAAGWSLKLANILEYDGNPPEDIKNSDWYWILALQYGF